MTFLDIYDVYLTITIPDPPLAPLPVLGAPAPPPVFAVPGDPLPDPLPLPSPPPP